MSRSRKKLSIFTDSSKFGKKMASKTVRNRGDVGDGKWYRRLYNPYNICDWKFYNEKGDKWYRKGFRK